MLVSFKFFKVFFKSAKAIFDNSIFSGKDNCSLGKISKKYFKLFKSFSYILLDIKIRKSS